MCEKWISVGNYLPEPPDNTQIIKHTYCLVNDVCRLCEWQDHIDTGFCCDAQASTASFAVYSSDECYRVYQQIPSIKEIL